MQCVERHTDIHWLPAGHLIVQTINDDCYMLVSLQSTLFFSGVGRKKLAGAISLSSET